MKNMDDREFEASLKRIIRDEITRLTDILELMPMSKENYNIADISIQLGFRYGYLIGAKMENKDAIGKEWDELLRHLKEKAEEGNGGFDNSIIGERGGKRNKERDARG